MSHSDVELEDLRRAIEQVINLSLLHRGRREGPARSKALELTWKMVEDMTARPIQVPGEDADTWTHRLKMAAWEALQYPASGKQDQFACFRQLRKCQDVLRVIQGREQHKDKTQPHSPNATDGGKLAAKPSDFSALNSPSLADHFALRADEKPGAEFPPTRPNSGLHAFDLPTVFQCAVELGEALSANHEVEIAGQRLQRVLNPRSAGFPEEWKQEIDLADATVSARQALLTIGLALADLRGKEHFHERGKELLSAGTWNLWDGMQLPERNAVRSLLPKAVNQWGWPHNDATGEPAQFDGQKATLSDHRVFLPDWWTGDIETLNSLGEAHGNFCVDAIHLANGRAFDIYRFDCKVAKGNKPSVCPKSDPRLPEQLRPAGEMLAELETRFRSLNLIGDGETIHWVGRQSTVETTCTCNLTKGVTTNESDRLYPRLSKEEFGQWATEAKVHLQPAKADEPAESEGKNMDPAANRHFVFRSLKQKFEAASQRFPEFKFVVHKADDREGLVRPYFIDRKSRMMEERFQPDTVEASGVLGVAGDEREFWHVCGPEEALNEYERLASEAGSAIPRTEDFPLRNILPLRVDPYISVSMKERWTLFVFDMLKRSGGAHIVSEEMEDQRRHRFDGENDDKPAYATYAWTSSNIFAASARAIEYAGLEEPPNGKTTTTNDAALSITFGSAVDHPPLRCKTVNEVRNWLEEWVAKFRDYPNTVPNYFLKTEYAGGIVQRSENPRMIMARVTVANFACNQVERWLRDNGHSTALSLPTDDKDLMAAERRLSNCLDYVRRLIAEIEMEGSKQPVDEPGIVAALANDKECPGCKASVPESARVATKFVCRTCREWELQTGVLVLPVAGLSGTPPEIVRVHAPLWKPVADSHGLRDSQYEAADAPTSDPTRCPACKSPVPQDGLPRERYRCKACGEWELNTGILIHVPLGNAKPIYQKRHAPFWRDVGADVAMRIEAPTANAKATQSVEQPAAGGEEAKTGDGTAGAIVLAKKKGRRGKHEGVDAKMTHILHDKPESSGWTIDEWITQTGFAESTIGESRTWKKIMEKRDEEKAERERLRMKQQAER